MMMGLKAATGLTIVLEINLMERNLDIPTSSWNPIKTTFLKKIVVRITRAATVPFLGKGRVAWRLIKLLHCPRCNGARPMTCLIGVKNAQSVFKNSNWVITYGWWTACTDSTSTVSISGWLSRGTAQVVAMQWSEASSHNDPAYYVAVVFVG